MAEALRKGAAGQTPTTPIQQRQTPGYAKFRKSPLDPLCFDMEEGLQYIATQVITDVKGKKGTPAYAVYLVDPCQAGTTPVKTATILDTSNVFSGIPPSTAVLPANFLHIFRTASAAPIGTAQSQSILAQGSLGGHNVTAVNTALAFILDLRECKNVFSFAMTSTGTSTVEIEGSIDNFVNSVVIIDIWPAAAATAKTYTPAILGTTGAGFTPVSPLSFRFLRITVGAAGGGFVSTIDVAAK